MCAFFNDQQYILACAPRTMGIRSNDRCSLCGLVCRQLCLGKKRSQNVDLQCFCTCTDSGLSKFCGRSFAVADRCVWPQFKSHSCSINRSRSDHDLPFNRCAARVRQTVRWKARLYSSDRDQVSSGIHSSCGVGACVGFGECLLRLTFTVLCDRSLTILGSAASGSALILTGVVVSSQTFRFDGQVAWTTAAIVLVQPLFALGITKLFHMSHAEIRHITLISAIPGGFFVFGKSFNSTPETASSALIASYCVGAFSMAGWMFVLTKYL
jgi:Membrane transport protein